MYGSDIIFSENMQKEKEFIQHGTVSVFLHSVYVAIQCLSLVRKYGLKVNERSLVRGALLHDYFLYDWHVPDPSHRLHGFFHPGKALENALMDYELTRLEQDIIRKHMFPLTLYPPQFKESWIVCMADKIVASRETLRMPCFSSLDLSDL